MPSWPAGTEWAHTDNEDGENDNGAEKPQIIKLGDWLKVAGEAFLSIAGFKRGKQLKVQTQRDEKLQPTTHYYKRICLFEGLSRGLNELLFLFTLNMQLMCNFVEGSSGAKSDIFLESDGMK